MIAVLTTIHVLGCVTLIFVVLLQAGRGAGLAGVFGASSSGGAALFGGRGAEGFLSKATAVLAILFMLTSISLSILSGRRSVARSVLMEEAQRAAQEATQQAVQTLPPGAGGEGAQGLPPLELPGTREPGEGAAPGEPETAPEGN